MTCPCCLLDLLLLGSVSAVNQTQTAARRLSQLRYKGSFLLFPKSRGKKRKLNVINKKQNTFNQCHFTPAGVVRFLT